MPKKRATADVAIINKVKETNEAVILAKANYMTAQEAHLQTLREARQQGETLENLADALECSKQWIHKWTTFGRDHNKVYKEVG